MKKDQTMTLRRFAKLLGYMRSSDREFKTMLKILTSRELVKIQQSGFYAHSCHHPKLVVILKPIELDYFKRIFLTKTNYRVADFTVHRTTMKRKCDDCSVSINPGERYGVKLKIGRYKQVFGGKTLCFPCLMARYSEDDVW